MSRYFNDYARKFNLNIAYNTCVEKIGQDGDEVTFVLHTNTGTTYKAQVVIMAAGPLLENTPNIPGAELCTTYNTHNTDQKYYENKKVAIIGGGNSGFEVCQFNICKDL